MIKDFFKDKEVEEEIFSGQGLMKAYISPISKEDLDKNEFHFEVQGQKVMNKHGCF